MFHPPPPSHTNPLLASTCSVPTPPGNWSLGIPNGLGFQVRLPGWSALYRTLFLFPGDGDKRGLANDKFSDDEDEDDQAPPCPNAQDPGFDVNDPFHLAEESEASIPITNAHAKDPDSEDPFRSVNLFRVQ